jgi:hypothetical protein
MWKLWEVGGDDSDAGASSCLRDRVACNSTRHGNLKTGLQHQLSQSQNRKFPSRGNRGVPRWASQSFRRVKVANTEYPFCPPRTERAQSL